MKKLLLSAFACSTLFATAQTVELATYDHDKLGEAPLSMTDDNAAMSAFTEVVKTTNTSACLLMDEEPKLQSSHVGGYKNVKFNNDETNLNVNLENSGMTGKSNPKANTYDAAAGKWKVEAATGYIPIISVGTAGSETTQAGYMYVVAKMNMYKQYWVVEYTTPTGDRTDASAGDAAVFTNGQLCAYEVAGCGATSDFATKYELATTFSYSVPGDESGYYSATINPQPIQFWAGRVSEKDGDLVYSEAGQIAEVKKAAADADNPTTDVNFVGVIKFPAYTGKTYAVYANGSKIGIAAYALATSEVDVEAWTPAVEDDPSTTDVNEAAEAMSFKLFTASGSAISSITADQIDENAPIYNLLGQKVGKNATGILIQNGKKFVRK